MNKAATAETPHPGLRELPASRHAVKCREAYDRGTTDGRKIASNEVYPKGQSDIWIILATCMCTLCVIALIFMRKAKLSLEQMENIRQDAATLMQLKEKELVTEQTQVRHLQGMHQEYITKCQKQLALISTLRKKRSSLLQVVSEENTKLLGRCREMGVLRRERRLKTRVLRKSKSGMHTMKFHLAHTVNMLVGGAFCASMWFSYNLGYCAG